MLTKTQILSAGRVVVTNAQEDRLATVSLRRHITIATIVLVVVVLAATLAAVYASFSVVSNRSTTAVLTAQIHLAEQLAQQNTPPVELVERHESRSVSAYLELPDGERFRSLRRRDAQAAGIHRRQLQVTALEGPLRDGKLIIAIDDRPEAAARARLARVLLIVTAAALFAIVLTMPVVARVVLRPLDTMTTVARAIAGGRRRQRFHPPSQTTELDRTAAAVERCWMRWRAPSDKRWLRSNGCAGSSPTPPTSCEHRSRGSPLQPGSAR